jgi:hypothetical protein
MPPQEATEMIPEGETSSPKKYDHRGQHGLVADWTSIVLHYRTSLRGTSPQKESVIASPATSTVSTPTSNKRQHGGDSSPPSSATFARYDDDNRKRFISNISLKSPTSPLKAKRKKGDTVTIFVYVATLTMSLLAYSEYQLWQLSDQEQMHNNILSGASNRSQPLQLWSVTTKTTTSLNGSLAVEQEERFAQSDINEIEELIEEQSDTIVHIVHSRFMQYQPDLIHLGEARLRLFQHFFLKSLEEQSSKNFCCIIRTDPDLHINLKQQLVDMLRSFNISHILVASNETPKSQYQDLLLDTVQSEDVWSGSLEEVKWYLRIGKATHPSGNLSPPRIIETRLDADDGLHRFFVEKIQAEADENYLFESQSWRLWCVAHHAEWQHESIWKNSPSVSNETGTIVALQVNYCVTPGLSIAFLGNKESLAFIPPTMKHEKLMHTRKCKKEKKILSNCRSFVPMSMGALRARTPTSAGMLNLVYNGTSINRKYIRGATKQLEFQGKLWWAVEKIFGFSKQEAMHINEYLNSHMKLIAEENLLGQCTRGHSCKNSSHSLLTAILEGSS